MKGSRGTRNVRTWFVLDLRFDDEHFKPWSELSLSSAVRMDLTNGKHP
jgi:hypothetical protein